MLVLSSKSTAMTMMARGNTVPMYGTGAHWLTVTGGMPARDKMMRRMARVTN